jgi:hypothetical protein
LGGVEVRVISSREKKYELPEDAPDTEPNRRYKQNSKLMPFEKTIKDIFKNLDDENVNKVEEEKKKLHLIVLGDGDNENNAAMGIYKERTDSIMKIIRFKYKPTIEQWQDEYKELVSGNYLEQMYRTQQSMTIVMNRGRDARSFEDQITGFTASKESQEFTASKESEKPKDTLKKSIGKVFKSSGITSFLNKNNKK